MNDLENWSQSCAATAVAANALSEDECAELFDLFDALGLSAGAMSAEMADGFLTACAVGPVPIPTAQWLSAVLGQSHFPICTDVQQQERLLQLLVRRYQHVRVCTAQMPTQANADQLFLPLQAQVDEGRRISPYRCNAQGVREGDWELKDWAEGFRRAMLGSGQWQPMLSNKDAWPLISPIVLFQSGFNPDKPDLQIDQRPEMLSVLVRCIYEMRQWWQAHAAAQSNAARAQTSPAPTSIAKVGRNDPCPCGSGKKYKKCCGAV